MYRDTMNSTCFRFFATPRTSEPRRAEGRCRHHYARLCNTKSFGSPDTYVAGSRVGNESGGFHLSGVQNSHKISLTVTILHTVADETHWFAQGGLVLLKELTALTVGRGPKTTTIAA